MRKYVLKRVSSSGVDFWFVGCTSNGEVQYSIELSKAKVFDDLSDPRIIDAFIADYTFVVCSKVEDSIEVEITETALKLREVKMIQEVNND